MNASLLTLAIHEDVPQLATHIDRWYQKVQVLKEDKTSLAEHHIYGSSRLGIQRYISGQKGYDALNTSGGAAQPLGQQRAWYSLWGNDLFAATPNAYASAQALGTGAMGTAGIGVQAHILGNRHYELTNHLGNVQATILDRVTPQLALPATDGGQSVLTGYSTDISSAQDYYPFGMLMPGRYISDNTPQCITTQTTVLVPRIVRVYIRDLEPVPPVRTNGYTPVVVQTYPWTTPVRQVPLAATFADQQPYFYNYLPASQHDEGFVARVVPGGGEYELDLSNEPTGLSLYLPFKTDTSAGGANQVLGFGVGRVPPGVRVEARVRRYGEDINSDQYSEALRWRDVREGEDVELRFGLPAGPAGKLMAELRFSAERGAPRFSSLAKVYIRNPWTETTEWIPETRLVTICEEKDKYRYGFNGQEKDNEVAGLGNHYTAPFWEYDTRTGRRWNLDPIVKPGMSGYSILSGNPVSRIDPNGADDYYNKLGKFIGRDGKGTAIRLMDNDNIQDENSFSLSMALASKFGIDIVKARSVPGMSREITFKNEGSVFKSMYADSKDGAERGTFIVLDIEKAEVRTDRIIIGPKGGGEAVMIGSGSQTDKGIIISTIHTHKQEEEYLSKGFSDEELFESQYTIGVNDADGNMSKSAGQFRYSIGKDNVNFYGPGGKSKSSNNAGSRKDLENGDYNIGKESLENYGKLPPKENNTNLFFVLCLVLNCLLSGCKRNKQQINQVAIKAESRKIIYNLRRDITNFIADSIMEKTLPALQYCAFNGIGDSDSITIEFHYVDDDYSAWRIYILENSSRYLQINEKMIPICFVSDMLFVSDNKLDKSKDIRKNQNWMNYATLKFLLHGDIIEYHNFYKQLSHKAEN